MFQYSHKGESNRSSQVDFIYSTYMPSNLGNMMNIRNRIRDKILHQQLKVDLVENIYGKNLVQTKISTNRFFLVYDLYLLICFYVIFI